MTEIYLILAILAGTVWLLVSEKIPATLAALISMSVLTAVGMAGVAAGFIRPEKWITTADILTSFSNPAVIAVASMFVLSGALEHSGVVDRLARLISSTARYRITLLAMLIAVSATLSAFVNNTAVVATLLPAVITVCARKGYSPSKFLIPLSYASQFGGVCTIIGTSTNLLGNELVKKAGMPAFRFFEFAPAGLIMLAVGTGYMLFVGRFILPDRTPESDPTSKSHPGEFVVELDIGADCPLVGRPSDNPKPVSEHDGTFRVLALERAGARHAPDPQRRLAAGDRLLVRANVGAIETLRHMRGLRFTAGDAPEGAGQSKNDPLILIQAAVAPRSQLAGTSLGALRHHERDRIVVIGVKRHSENDTAPSNDDHLAFGDTLLLLTRLSRMYRIRDNPSLIILHEKKHRTHTPFLACLAAATFAMVILSSIWLAIPIETAALIGAVVSVAIGCIRLDDAIRAIDWKVILLLAGLLPMGVALEKSGAATLAAETVLRLTGDFGPIALLALIYLVTATLTEFMSNNASAVLLTPVAITAALKLGVDPRPFVVAVLFAASTSFATPVGYQTNAMVYGPGGYRFGDFIKVGIPLNLSFWALAVWIIPKFWPFHPVP